MTKSFSRACLSRAPSWGVPNQSNIGYPNIHGLAMPTKMQEGPKIALKHDTRPLMLILKFDIDIDIEI